MSHVATLSFSLGDDIDMLRNRHSWMRCYEESLRAVA